MFNNLELKNCREDLSVVENQLKLTHCFSGSLHVKLAVAPVSMIIVLFLFVINSIF